MARLTLATSRVEDAKREQVWAIAAAHSAGISIRKIALATALSSSRIHQLLHSDEASQVPEWLNNPVQSSDEKTIPESPCARDWQQQLAKESEVIRWCVGWLEQLTRDKKVVVNLRADSDPKTAYVGIDQKWVQRVMKRVAADLEQLSGQLAPTDESTEEDPIEAGIKHRRRLGEPEPELSSLSQQEQRAIVREKMGI